MKNQNDLIFSIVGIVVLLIVVGVCFGTKPVPQVPTPPAAVNLSDPQLPQGVTPVMATSLPGGSTNNQPGGAMGGPRGGGGDVSAPSGGGGGGRAAAGFSSASGQGR